MGTFGTNVDSVGISILIRKIKIRKQKIGGKNEKKN